MAERHIIQFYGTVQGVGFRYTACRIAAQYTITGYVQNLPDGSVKCVAEGEPGEIDRFIDELTERMAGHIRSTDRDTAPATNEWTAFGVRY